MVIVLDGGLIIIDFEIQSRYDVYFLINIPEDDMNLFIIFTRITLASNNPRRLICY